MIQLGFWCAVMMEFVSILVLIFKDKTMSMICRFLKDKKEEEYTDKLSIDMSNTFFSAGFIVIIGVILGEFISEKILIVTLIISILFIVIRIISISSDKVFKVYKKFEQ